jgi:eukaryotic-like serine/threonine-protein kinase
MAHETQQTTEGLEIEALIGTGSVGEVWRARLADGTIVALKRMLPHAARHEPSVLAFEREARLYGKFETPGVPRCFGHGSDDQGPYLLLEYVEGTTLSDLLGEPIAVPLALRVARDVLAVLETVHNVTDDDGRRLGLVHRDLSPMNVLIGIAGVVKLADFGIARSTVGTHATTGVMAKGTLGYMSPEQARGQPLDARSDLFAVGALLHEMLAGSPPYDEQDPRLALARARAGDITPFADTLPGVDPTLGDLVDQALAAEPVERFPSAERMRIEVERVAERLGLASDEQVAVWARSKPRAEQPAPPHIATPPGPPTSHRRGWIAVVAVLALSIGAFVLWRPSSPDAPASAAPAQPPTPKATPSSDFRDSPGTISSALGDEPVQDEPTPSPSARPAPPRSSRDGGLPLTPGSATAQEPAVLDIGSSPSFAYVTIDGRRLGATPLFGIRLAPGTHTITVEREELGARTITIDLRPGQRARKVIPLP